MKLYVKLMVAGVAAAALLTGCSKKSTAKAAAETPAGDTELNLYVWTEYIPDAVIQKFTDDTGIKVNMSTYSSNEDMLAKVKAETQGAYDVVQPSDYMVEHMIKEDMLAELDKSKLTNLGNLAQQYLNPTYDPGNKYSVPYLGGLAAIGVNTAKVTKNITSYNDLFDPSLAGTEVVLDDFRAVIGMTARSMGYSMNETDHDKLAKIAGKLYTLKPNVKLYDSDSPKSALISGDCTVAYCWGAEIALAMRENPAIKIVYPTEGAYKFMDNWAVLKGAKHPDAAVKFINFMLDPKVHEMVLAEFPYMSPNATAVKEMGEEYASNTAINPPKEAVEAGEFVQNLDPETLALYDAMWTKLKS
ncbi:MAG: spermidine/putrescine ABC transporter substrate-binding protein [Treponema sp.]|nr:spermidine/putrescine ABC transporter substrate-binding protein [Treponema sp.]